MYQLPERFDIYFGIISVAIRTIVTLFTKVLFSIGILLNDALFCSMIYNKFNAYK